MPALWRSASCMARRRLPGSWMVSASVKSSQRPRACFAAVQMALALPVQTRFRFLELCGLDYSDAGKAAGDFGGAVGGVVVDYNEFPVVAELEDLLGLADEGLKTGGEAILLIARGDDDGELDELGGLGLGKDGSGKRLCRPIRASRQDQRRRWVRRRGRGPAYRWRLWSFRRNPVRPCSFRLILLPFGAVPWARPFVGGLSLRIISMCGSHVGSPFFFCSQWR